MPELNFNPGDQVRLRLAKEELSGTIIESHDNSIVLLKLSSGYNVGIAKENILSSRILKKFSPQEKKHELQTNKNLPKIGFIMTGGTISSKVDPKTGGVAPLTDVNDLTRFYPEMFNIVSIKRIEMPFLILSENMSNEYWISLAENVKRLLDDEEIQGVIITHGTDTLHYTASALSFFLQNLNKPVVLTYSQRSIDRASSDANLNLQCAARFALSNCAEVVIVGHASSNDDFCFAMRGTKVRKLHTSRRDAFRSVNDNPLAKISAEKIEFLEKYKTKSNTKIELDTSFTDKVALIKFYPGQDPSILDFHALKYKGIVIEAGGLGGLPTSGSKNSWIPKLKKHIKEGLVVCITSQCIFGRVDQYVYSGARELIETGVIFLDDMLAETALVKLGWVLGHYGWKAHLKEKMLENIAGELNDRLEFNNI